MRLVSFHISVFGKVIKKDQDNLQQLGRNGRLLPTQSSSKQDTKLLKENIPNFIKANKLENYFMKRYILFEQYNKGIQLDAESWYSVTPQCIAEHIAKVSACSTIIDAFCGAGGTAIQFAKTCKQVIAIDIDETKIQMARNNARIYGVEHKIKFIHGNFLTLADGLKGDVIFLDPPWGGPGYQKTFNIENILTEFGSSGIKLFETARQIQKNIIYHLPRNTNVSELQRIFPKDVCVCVKVVEYEINNHTISHVGYFGDLASELQLSQLPQTLYDKGIEVRDAYLRKRDEGLI